MWGRLRGKGKECREIFGVGKVREVFGCCRLVREELGVVGGSGRACGLVHQIDGCVRLGTGGTMILSFSCTGERWIVVNGADIPLSASLAEDRWKRSAWHHFGS